MGEGWGEGEEIWVLVHDAARPCVRADDLSKLIKDATQNDHGGLLALPVRDTMKRQTADGHVEADDCPARAGTDKLLRSRTSADPLS